MTLGQRLREEGREEGREVGRSEGRAEGLRTAIATALSARGLPLSELARSRLDSCTDVATLTRWLTRAVTASSESEVFAS